VALLSAASLALSLLFTRIFSVTMFYHVAFLLVSLAMLGIAVAGVVIYLLPGLFSPRRRLLLAGLASVAIGPLALRALKVTVENPLSLALNDENLRRLVKLYGATSLPFLASGFAISLAIASAGKDIGRIYAYDLIGAAAGCIAIIPLTARLSAPGAIVLAGALAAVGGALLASACTDHPRSAKAVAALGALVALGLVGAVLPRTVHREYFRFAQGTKFLREDQVQLERWNAFSRITVSPGTNDFHWIHIDSDAATAIWRREYLDPAFRPEDYTNKVSMVVYAVRNEGPALIIGPGGGPDVLFALRQGVPRVVGVEVNPLIVGIMRGSEAAWSGGLYNDPRVQIVVDDGRSFIRRSPERYSSIQATLVDTWAASASGAFTLSENSLYTVEAYSDYLAHLRDDGMLSITRWYGPEVHRSLLLGRAALSLRGVSEHLQRQHFWIAGDGRAATVLLKRNPFTPAELERLEAFAQRTGMGVMYRADRAAGNLPELGRTIEAPVAEVIAQEARDLSPVTDDRPFFFFHTKSQDFYTILRRVSTLHNQDTGLVILQVIVLLSLAFAFVLVVLPLAVFRRAALRGERLPKLRLVLYFACLGLGFILVELGLMQRFILFLGHPIYALSVVLSTLLLASGVGSALSTRLLGRFGVAGSVRRVVAVLLALLLVYALSLGPLFLATLGLPLAMRIAVASLLVGAIGVPMGTLLPLGVQASNRFGQDVTAWGWGVNGATSVVGSTLSMSISINYGFTTTLLVGIGAYALGGLLLGAARDAAVTLAPSPDTVPGATEAQNTDGLALQGAAAETR
jgi:predicted membrane-bound spermidine synthase